MTSVRPYLPIYDDRDVALITCPTLETCALSKESKDPEIAAQRCMRAAQSILTRTGEVSPCPLVVTENLIRDQQDFEEPIREEGAL